MIGLFIFYLKEVLLETHGDLKEAAYLWTRSTHFRTYKNLSWS
jgi:hypothetical protein